MADPEMDQWATHLPALMACAAATKGPILECGAGIWSTPILHALCAPSKRPLLTVESNGEWIERFRYLASPSHELQAIVDWNVLPEGKWSVAFVDHGQAPRGPVIAALRERAGIVVMHDSECDYCGYSEPLRSFDWCYTHIRSDAWTTIAGMGKPPKWIEEALSPGRWGVLPTYR